MRAMQKRRKITARGIPARDKKKRRELSDESFPSRWSRALHLHIFDFDYSIFQKNGISTSTVAAAKHLSGGSESSISQRGARQLPFRLWLSEAPSNPILAQSR